MRKIREYYKIKKCTNITLIDVLYNWVSSELKYKDIELSLYREIQYIRWHLTHPYEYEIENNEVFIEKYSNYLNRSHLFINDLIKDITETLKKTI